MIGTNGLQRWRKSDHYRSMNELHKILLRAIDEACEEQRQPAQIAARIKAWVEAAAKSQLPAEDKLQRLGDIRDAIKVEEQQ